MFTITCLLYKIWNSFTHWGLLILYTFPFQKLLVILREFQLFLESSLLLSRTSIFLNSSLYFLLILFNIWKGCLVNLSTLYQVFKMGIYNVTSKKGKDDQQNATGAVIFSFQPNGKATWTHVQVLLPQNSWWRKNPRSSVQQPKNYSAKLAFT